jgi:hypothetical protein
MTIICASKFWDWRTLVRDIQNPHL